MIFKKYVIFLVVVLMAACAKEGFPPGGPEDKTPPKVVSTYPVPGSTEVDPGTDIQVWFSESIEPRSSREAVFITPYIDEEGRKIRIRGRQIKITFSEPLDSNRTYVVTFGTGIKDYRNNAMEASFTLAFSTGEVLDRGEMAGRVYGVQDARGVDVWAYILKDGLDPDPAAESPDYIVQCEAGGQFTFSNISPGLYRLFAVRDRRADRLYQAGEDEVGVTFRDVLLSRGDTLRADHSYFRMTREDTLGPSLIRAEATHRNHLRLRFDEPISTWHPLSPNDLSIVAEEDSLDTLGMNDVYLDPMNDQMVHVLTRDQTDGKRYALTLMGLQDEAGNPVDSASIRVVFEGTGRPDTTAPQLMQSEPSPGTQMTEVSGRVRLTFSEAMDTARFRDGFTFADTLENRVAGVLRWSNPADVVFMPGESLESLTEYWVSLDSLNIVDLAGNALTDTLFSLHSMDADTLSEVAGSVVDPDTTEEGRIHIIARQVRDSKIAYTIIIPQPGIYRIDAILPGEYLLECFRDRDGNGRYSLGKPFPYEPSERFIVYSDTVKIRSRWPNEGNDIILP